MSVQPGVKATFVPHKTLKEGWTYISIKEDGTIIGVKIAITKVSKLLAPDGTPLKDNTGNFIYSFQSSNVVKLLTSEEYDQIKGEGGE